MVDQYENLKKEFNLPDLEDILERFEIVLKKGEEGPILQTIRSEITEKIYDIAKTIEAMIFSREGGDPDVLYIEKMIEHLMDDCYQLYKELNQLYSNGVRLGFEHNRKADAEFIKTVFNSWGRFEEKLKIIFKAIEDGWKNFEMTDDLKEEVYHG